SGLVPGGIGRNADYLKRRAGRGIVESHCFTAGPGRGRIEIVQAVAQAVGGSETRRQPEGSVGAGRAGPGDDAAVVDLVYVDAGAHRDGVAGAAAHVGRGAAGAPDGGVLRRESVAIARRTADLPAGVDPGGEGIVVVSAREPEQAHQVVESVVVGIHEPELR